MVATLTANGDKRGEGRLDLSREREEWRPNMAATGTKGEGEDTNEMSMTVE